VDPQTGRWGPSFDVICATERQPSNADTSLAQHGECGEKPQQPCDCNALNPYRQQHSGVAGKKGLWEVRHDPYDISQVWVLNHHDGGWISVPWTHLKATPAPFGELAWDHARRQLARRGEDPATEQEIAAAASALLDKAEQGRADADGSTKKDRRVAARTRATAPPGRPLPQRPEPDEEPEPSGAQEDDQPVAKVIPLGIFDPFQEAAKRW